MKCCFFSHADEVLPTLSFSLESKEGHARLDTLFPPLQAVTVCARVQWDQRHDQVSTIFSYAAPVFINEFQLRGRADGADRKVLLALIVQGHHCPYKAYFPNDGDWHQVCVSWRNSDGLWAIHVDGQIRDTGSRVDTTTRDIHGGGIFIVGQDQDSFGGDFTEPFVGNITDLNVWNATLGEAQIHTLKACRPLENLDAVFSWSSRNLTLHEDAKEVQANIYCPGRTGTCCMICLLCIIVKKSLIRVRRILFSWPICNTILAQLGCVLPSITLL